jgi:hypothetical protein
MITALIRKLTGRSYTIRTSDLGYLLAKGGWPMARGMIWSAIRPWRANTQDRSYGSCKIGPSVSG